MKGFNFSQQWLCVIATYTITLPKLILMVIWFNILYIINPKKLEEMMNKKAGYPMVDYADQKQKLANKNMSVPFTLGIRERMRFVGTHRFILKRLKVALLDARKLAKIGGDAPNVQVLELKSNQRKNLLDFQNGCRPLVLNFGNCT
jgi:Iodothyronine deiodinase.